MLRSKHVLRIAAVLTICSAYPVYHVATWSEIVVEQIVRDNEFQLRSGIDAGAGAPQFPIDPSQALSTSPLYAEDIDPILVGDDIFASLSGPNGVFYAGSQTTNGPQAYTPFGILWGSGSIQFDSSDGYAAINMFATAGQSCATINSNFTALVTPHINGHARDIVIECGLNEGASSATTCAHIQAVAATAVSAVAGVSGHVYVNTMLDAPSLAPGFASAVNVCLRAASISPAKLIDVAADPYLGLAAGSLGGSCTNDRRCWYGAGSDAATLSAPNGAIRYAYIDANAINNGGWQ